MVEEPASPSDGDLAQQVAHLRADAAPAYALVYDEARRALDGQERALAAFRTRAGIVLSAAAIVTSFLGGQAIGANGFTTLSWVAIAAFAVVGVATLCVLWPDDNWQFEAIPNQVIGTYVERDDALDVPLHAIHRDLALHMENSHSSNERRRLRPLRWAFRAAVIALVAEGLDLAHRARYCRVEWDQLWPPPSPPHPHRRPSRSRSFRAR